MGRTRWLPLLIAALLAGGCASVYMKGWKKQGPKDKHPQLPENMVFVTGEGDMASFYIGMQEESNLDYLTYLIWLQNVFGDSYPDVYERALPRALPPDGAYFNDPFISDYFEHPALSHYPVVGLSWLQIQDYLAWKTNRWNESILIDRGFMELDTNQKGEDNFNTEAYIVGQYAGGIVKNLPNSNFPWEPLQNEEEHPILKDNILHPGFRLPTEAEWERAATYRLGEDSRKAERRVEEFPYGKKYFLNKWYGEYFNTDLKGREFEPFYIRFITRKVQGDFFTAEPTGQTERDSTHITSYLDYKDYGIVNMEGGVSEWLYDRWHEPFDPSVTNTWEIVKHNGGMFDVPAVDDKGAHLQKDGLGRLRYGARWFDTKGGEWHLVIERHQLHGVATAALEYLENKEEYDASIGKGFSRKNYRSRYCKEAYEYTLHLHENSDEVPEITADMLRAFIERTQNDRRVVRGGDWRNPSLDRRKAMPQHKASERVGFRVVLPYVPIPRRD